MLLHLTWPHAPNRETGDACGKPPAQHIADGDELAHIGTLTAYATLARAGATRTFCPTCLQIRRQFDLNLFARSKA